MTKINWNSIAQNIYDNFDSVVEVFGLDIIQVSNGEWTGIFYRTNCSMVGDHYGIGIYEEQELMKI